MNRVIFLLIFSNILISELILEVTQGTDDPYRVALVTFNGDAKTVNEINSVIRNNLIRSGEFNIFEDDDLLSVPKNENEIIYNDFKILNIDFLVFGEVFIDGNSNSVEYKVFDIKRGAQVRNSTVFGIPNRNRQLAHYVSDGIYEEITGIKGISATKILYVTENNNFNLVISDADGKNEQLLLTSSEPIISPTWSPDCLLYTSPSPRDSVVSRMPSSA